MAKSLHSKKSFQWIIQYVSLSIFIFLLSMATYPSKGSLPLDIYLRLDPLIAIGTTIASREVIEKAFIALFTIFFTLLAGRIFCGYICPLGTVIDIFERYFNKAKKRSPKVGIGKTKSFRKYRNIKYILLIFTLVSAVFGMTFFFIFDPISLFTRTFAHFFHPLFIFISNGALDLIRPVATKMGFIELSHKQFIQPAFDSNMAIFFMFGAILLLSTVKSRFWCRYLCPLGALLGVCSKHALIKREVSENCNNCGLCRKKCPMDAIGDEFSKTIQSECIQCQVCKDVCPQKAIDFRYTGIMPENTPSSVNLSRRSVLNAVGAGVVLSFLAKTNTARAHNNIVRPPGAIPEEEFLARCVRCGECIKSCITNTLQPALFESGIEGLWTPRHHMRHAGCEQQCNMCGTVCPTQAIRALPLHERKYARVGTAVINRHKCLAWEQNRLCIICDEQCPYNAIVFKNISGIKRPFVDETKCNGCGICEEKCPISGDSAIIVYPIGEIRIKKGSYVKESRRLKLAFNEENDELDDTSQRDKKPAPTMSTHETPRLPTGFILEQDK